ncbi:unnamed protein product [Ilex paraguariensis]|uniref:Uncharacterized protein n=1 Tax=Ilex paraguariensis TaxID=185542 RepID=A0ABC8QXY0_9AQUA
MIWEWEKRVLVADQRWFGGCNQSTLTVKSGFMVFEVARVEELLKGATSVIAALCQSFIPQLPMIFLLLTLRSVLYFISDYFTRRGSQGDLRDTTHLRQNLLRAVLALSNSKECSRLNEQMVVLLPAAVYALCAGCAPFAHSDKWFSASNPFSDVPEAAEDRMKAEHGHEGLREFFEYSVDVLAEISPGSGDEVAEPQCHQSVRLPRQLSDPLLQEMEAYFLEAFVDKDTEKMLLSDVIFTCALLSNFIYGLDITSSAHLPFVFQTCHVVNSSRIDDLGNINKKGSKTFLPRDSSCISNTNEDEPSDISDR